jgi:hypothetical protein
MKIKCAAILHKDIIYEGRTHAEIGWKMIDDGVCSKPFPSSIFQGFVTEGGNFVDRKLALHIAIEANQVEEGKTCHKKLLFSEDLIHSKVWDYPYKDKYTRKN